MALFVQAMLSKADNSTVTIPTITETTQISTTKRINTDMLFVLYFDLTTEKRATYSLNLTPSKQYYWLKVVVNDVTKIEDTTMQESTAQRNINLWELDKNSNIKVYFRSGYSAYQDMTLSWNFNLSINKVYKFWKNIKIYTLKNIWEKLTGILFGMLPDGTRRDGN